MGDDPKSVSLVAFKKTLKTATAASTTKKKKKKKKESSLSHSSSGHVCDRCGKAFHNGHALGGHKKYCGKPQFSKKHKKKTKTAALKKRKPKRHQETSIT